MSLYREFLEWRQRLEALIAEGDDLARRLEEVEKQNSALQRSLLDAKDPGFEALAGLYDEGFHICPAEFGHQREDDCLFCLNFLYHKGKKE